MPQIDVLANEVWASGHETGNQDRVLVRLGNVDMYGEKTPARED